jgi:hypothetical protein
VKPSDGLGLFSQLNPRVDLDRMTEHLRRNPAEDAAKWNAIMMRQAVAQQGENLVAVITARVKEWETKLKEGEALVVYCDAGRDRVHVESFEFPNWHLAIVVGLDDEGNRAYRIENVQDIKLTCKILKGAPKNPIGFILPEESKAAEQPKK